MTASKRQAAQTDIGQSCLANVNLCRLCATIKSIPYAQIMWLALSHLLPHGVRHHNKNITQGNPIADKTIIASITSSLFYLLTINLTIT